MRATSIARQATSSFVRNPALSPHGVARALSIAASASPAIRKQALAASSRLPSSASSRLTPSISSPAASLSSRRSYSSPIPTESLINVTSLPNGVRVATDGSPGHFSAVGVYVDAGSRYERPWIAGESGVSHLLDRMAFKTTTNRSADVMTSEIEKLGGNVMCSSSRETIMYQSSMFNQDVEAVLSILADTIQHPRLLSEELDIQREAANWEIGEIWNKPEMILPELLHVIAYRGNTLGNPLLCPKESLDVMTVDNLRHFMDKWFTPERIVIAGAGMPHEKLVELSERLFGSAKPRQSVLDLAGTKATSASSSRSSSLGSLWSSASSASSASSHSSGSSADFSTTAAQNATLVDPPGYPDTTALASMKAEYTGGELYLPRDDLEFTHVYVAFEGVSIHDDDIYALATLQILLGGGSSFSAGGPGKGMYSRLYNVLNRHHSVDFCSAFLHSYADSALFGIAASCDPSFNGLIGNVIANQLELCCGSGLRGGGITLSELARARNQLKSSLMMALESRLVEVEDLGRQIQAHGKKVTVEEMCEKIDQVDLSRLEAVAKRVLRPQQSGGKPLNHGKGSGQATVVAQGKLEGLGDLRQELFNRGLGARPTSME